MQLQSVGEVTKLTLGHDNKGYSPEWHLDCAELLDEGTGKWALARSAISISRPYQVAQNKFCLASSDLLHAHLTLAGMCAKYY